MNNAGVEAGSGNNAWVNNRMDQLLNTKREVGLFRDLYFLFRIFCQVPPFRGGVVSINSTSLQVEHVELKEFLEIVADIKEVNRTSLGILETYSFVQFLFCFHFTGVVSGRLGGQKSERK